MTSAIVPSDEIRRQYPRAYEGWRPVDDLILIAMVHTRNDVDKMAQRLGRTPGEIAAQLDRLGLA